MEKNFQAQQKNKLPTLDDNNHLTSLARIIWENAIEIDFGNKEEWDRRSLRFDWYKYNNQHDKWTSQSEGWYWFICEIDFNEIKDLNRPQSLPSKGCDFGDASKNNLEIFGPNILLCSQNKEKGGLVIYNGHEKNVARRIRAHFALNNDKTGALGIKHYPLSAKKWKVLLFTTQQIQNLDQNCNEEKELLKRLIKSKTGRVAVENAWRIEFGWPILCKA